MRGSRLCVHARPRWVYTHRRCGETIPFRHTSAATLNQQRRLDVGRTLLRDRGCMAEQSISCPSCGKKIPLTRALRAEIEESVRQRFDETLRERERELRAKYEHRLEEDLQRA